VLSGLFRAMNEPSIARIYRPTSRNLGFLARRVRAGELVAVPTETVYGLAADALNPEACAKIFEAKDRPTQDPLIVHVYAMSEVDEIAHWNPQAKILAKRFWPGPLTLVLMKKSTVPALVTAGLDSVAIRMPAHPVMRRLLKIAHVPVAAPSANPFGYISPTTALHVREHLGHRIKFILNGGPSRVGLESTIIDLREPRRPVLLRPGAITKFQLEEALAAPVRSAIWGRNQSARVIESQRAPGMLNRHYSPRTPVFLHRRITETDSENSSHAYVFMRKPADAGRTNVFWFDSSGDLHGAAHHLFAILRKVDALNFKAIHVERAPTGGLGDAINDRLQRAAAR
jgi:L-threonylcarbamoyladenylate synthase